MSKHHDAATALITAAGIKLDTLACTGKAQAASIICNKSLPALMLPESFRLCQSQDDVQSVIDRVATDEALVISVFRALGGYLSARFEDKTFDVATVETFYADYQKADAATQRKLAEATLRILDDVLTAETKRCAGDNLSADEYAEMAAEMDKLFAHFETDSIFAVLEAFAEAPTFLIQLAIIIAKGDANGQSVLDSRDENRTAGQMMGMFYSMMLGQLINRILEATLKAKLDAETFAQVEALLEKAQADDEGDEVTLH